MEISSFLNGDTKITKVVTLKVDEKEGEPIVVSNGNSTPVENREMNKDGLDVWSDVQESTLIKALKAFPKDTLQRWERTLESAQYAKDTTFEASLKWTPDDILRGLDYIDLDDALVNEIKEEQRNATKSKKIVVQEDGDNDDDDMKAGFDHSKDDLHDIGMQLDSSHDNDLRDEDICLSESSSKQKHVTEDRNWNHESDDDQNEDQGHGSGYARCGFKFNEEGDEAMRAAKKNTSKEKRIRRRRG